jgi:hypothetical protein
MNWYLAKIVYQIICGDGDHRPQFDEQLRLISAANEYEAFHKAQRVGITEEEKFLNNRQCLVEWKFVDVCELHPLSELIDGAELYSRIEETDDAGSYIDIIHRKADYIEGDNALRSLQFI